MAYLAASLVISLLGGLQQEDPKKAEADEAVKKFKAEYGAPGASEDARAKACKNLSSVTHRRTMSVLGGLLGGEAVMVSCAAADELGGFGEVKGAGSVLLSGLSANGGKPRHLVKLAIIKALGAAGAEEALETLHGISQSKPFDSAKEAVIAIGKIREKRSIPLLIALLKKAEVDPAAQGANIGDVGGTGVPYLPPGAPQAPSIPNAPQIPNLPGVAAGGGYSNGNEEQMERKRMLQAPLNEALASITKEKWSTAMEWEKWWQKYGASLKIDK